MHPFILKLKHKIQGKYYSEFQSVFKGSGYELAELRKYTQGDTQKRINWKQSAKHNQLITNLFQESKSVDLDISLDVNYNRKAKQDTILSALEDVFLYAKKHMLPTQIFLPPVSGRFIPQKVHKDFLGAYVALQQLPSLISTSKKKYISHLADFCSFSAKNPKKRAIVLVSDCLLRNSEIQHSVSLLQSKHHIVIMHVSIDTDFGQNYEFPSPLCSISDGSLVIRL